MKRNNNQTYQFFTGNLTQIIEAIAENVVLKIRTRLTDKSVDSLICLKAYFRSNENK